MSLLDLENAMQQALIDKPWSFSGFQQISLISTYFSCICMILSNPKYYIEKQKLDITVMVGCKISLLLFTLVMKMILHTARDDVSNE